MLNDNDFMRYSRQLLLEEIGPEGQERLANAKALIVGMGGLGTPAALYLAAGGVGNLTLADDDRLHVSNLQRQILYSNQELNQPKAQLARSRLLAVNPGIHVVALDARLQGETLRGAVQNADLVLDCSDNMATRQAVNQACVQAGKPLISGSAVGFGGQLMVLEPPYTSGCYRCLWPDEAEPERNCRNAGVLGPVVGVIGTLQALEALKMLAGMPSALSGQVRLFDGRQQNWRTFHLNRDHACPVCGEAG